MLFRSFAPKYVDRLVTTSTPSLTSEKVLTLSSIKVIFVFKLKDPYTVKATPQIDIAFNTKQAIEVFEVENGEETGLCPAGAKQNGTCDPINQGAMCAFRLGKVGIEITMKDAKEEAGPPRVKGDFR